MLFMHWILGLGTLKYFFHINYWWLLLCFTPFLLVKGSIGMLYFWIARKTYIHLSIDFALLSHFLKLPTLKKALELPDALGICVQHKRLGRMESALQAWACPNVTFFLKIVTVFLNQVLPFSMTLGDTLKFSK